MAWKSSWLDMGVAIQKGDGPSVLSTAKCSPCRHYTSSIQETIRSLRMKTHEWRVEKLKYEFPRLDIRLLNLPWLIEATSSTAYVMIRGRFLSLSKKNAISKPKVLECAPQRLKLAPKFISTRQKRLPNIVTVIPTMGSDLAVTLVFHFPELMSAMPSKTTPIIHP